MFMFRIALRPLLAALALLAASSAHAQWAVIDVTAIAQLVQEVQTLEDALTTARSELQQAQQSYQAITGARGMQNLLAGTVRNYLPASLDGLVAAAGQAEQGYAALATIVQESLRTSAVLTPQQFAALPPDLQAQLTALRNTAAQLRGITGVAVATASARFASLQQLIDTIGTAGDQKSILELQARIGAEQDMLQNDGAKLQAAYQALTAQDWTDRQQQRERVIAGHGQFDSRFEPHP